MSVGVVAIMRVAGEQIDVPRKTGSPLRSPIMNIRVTLQARQSSIVRDALIDSSISVSKYTPPLQACMVLVMLESIPSGSSYRRGDVGYYWQV